MIITLQILKLQTILNFSFIYDVPEIGISTGDL